MDIKIIRERRKTLVLKILNEKEIEVKAPLKLSETKIYEFINLKQGWINKKIKKMKEFEEFSKKFDFERYIYRFSSVAMETKTLSLDFSNETKKWKLIKKQYLSMFEILHDRARELADNLGVEVKKISPCSSKCRWGSFNTQKEMKFNYKLIILPKHLIDYVIYHELCHSKHMNHKPQFWKEVEKYCPKYKTYRREMREFSFVLKTPF